MNRLPEAADTRRPLRFVLFAWLAGSTWLQLTGGAVFTRFGRSLGVSDAGFGILAALPYLGALVQLPIGFLIERGVDRRRLFLLSGIVGRSTWILIGVLPWVLPPGAWWPCFLGLYALAVTSANVDNPCWISWMADLLPRRFRGRFLSSRTRLGQFVAFLLPLPAGWLLDQAATAGASPARLAASSLMVCGGLAGLLEILLHAHVPDLPRSRRPAPSDWRGVFVAPLRDHGFRHLLAFNGLMAFAVGFVGQYVWLYLFDVVALSNVEVNVVLILVPTLVQLAVMGTIGRLVDRFGRKPVMIISGILVVNGAFAWALVDRTHWWLGYTLALLATVGWPALEVARFNLLLGFTQFRAGRGAGGGYVAWNSLAVAVGGTLSGLVGAWVARTLGPEWRVVILGWTFTYHGALFALSSVARAVALLALFGLEDPGAQRTRVAMRYIVTSLYSNLQLVAQTPMRMVRRMGSASWHAGNGRPPPRGG